MGDKFSFDEPLLTLKSILKLPCGGEAFAGAAAATVADDAMGIKDSNVAVSETLYINFICYEVQCQTIRNSKNANGMQ